MRQEFLNRPDVMDSFTFALIGGISTVTSAVLFLSHLLIKDLRKQPGDLIMMMGFSELILSQHWLQTGLFTTYLVGDIEDDSLTCQINSVLSIMGGSLEHCYNFSFLLYILFNIRNSIRSGFMPHISFHVVSWLVTFLTLGYEIFNENLGRNSYGTCTLKKASIFSFAVYLVIVLSTIFLGFYVIFYTERTLPQHTKQLAKLKRDFLNFYKSYILVCIVCSSIILVSNFIQNLGDDEISPSGESDVGNYLFNVGKLGHSAKVMYPLILFFIRITDPLLKKRIWAPVEKMKSIIFFGIVDEEVEQKLPSNRRVTSSGELITVETETIDDKILIDNEEDTSWLKLLPSKIKEVFTRTFLSGISAFYDAVIEEAQSQNKPICKDSYEEINIYDIDGNELLERLGEPKSTIFDCKLTVYAPNIFKDIIDSHFEAVDFSSSFSIINNKDNISKAGKSDGGKSGELFMFSHDRKLILKTITESEARVFIRILPSYRDHLVKNTDTKIAKIFGLFDFDFQEAGKSIKLYVLENINSYNIDTYLRTYDLKGSKHSRTVCKSPETFEKGVKSKQVMKDNDFLAIDQAMRVTPSQRFELINIIRKDVELFRRHKLIDYSFLVTIVKTDDETGRMLEGELNKGNKRIVKDAVEPNKFYFLGTIDYFQEYNWNKWFERVFKMVMQCNPRLQTSSQPPNFYSTRFFGFVRSIIQDGKEESDKVRNPMEIESINLVGDNDHLETVLQPSKSIIG